MTSDCTERGSKPKVSLKSSLDITDLSGFHICGKSSFVQARSALSLSSGLRSSTDKSGKSSVLLASQSAIINRPLRSICEERSISGNSLTSKKPA